MVGGSGGLVSADVRRHNLSLVLRYVAESGPASRTDIAEGTGLTRGAVTGLVQVLDDAGLLRETTSVSGGKGRPRTNLVVAGDNVALLAVQIASDEVTGILAGLAGDELLRITRPHEATPGDPDLVLDTAASVMRELRDRANTDGRSVADVTVVVLAPVGGEPRRVLGDATLSWRSVDLVGGLRYREPWLTRVPISLDSDAPVAAMAELRRLGGDPDAIYIKGDSTIGGAIVVRGEVLEGAHEFAGSLGHLAVVPGGVKCVCGQSGCLVTVAGIEPLAAAAGMDPRLARRTPRAALAEFVDRVEAADASATRAWTDALEWIARTLAILSMAVDPELVVVGGQWAPLAPSIAAALRRILPDLANDVREPVRVVAGVLGPDAALRGAIDASRQRLFAAPRALLNFNA